MNATSFWNYTEPPKDRPILLHGAVFVKDEMGCFKEPVLGFVRFDATKNDDGKGMWVYTDNELSVRGYYEGELQCYAWAESPESNNSPVITLEASDAKAVAA